MIKNIQITNPLDEKLTLEMERPEESGFSILSIDGLGPTKAIINTSRVLSIPGSVFNSSTSSQRNIVMELGFMDYPSIEENRQKSYRYFPTNKKVLFKITTDRRVGIVEGYVESNEPNIFSKKSSTIISLLCPDAFFKAEEQIETVFSGTVSGFKFPFMNNSLTEKHIVFGNLTLDTSASVFYTGDADTGLMIYIYFVGPATNLKLYNVDQRQTMSISSDKLIALTGSGFIAGDSLEISTIKGNKYITLIRAGVKTNILNTLDVSNDWFQISKGDNLFTFIADSGQGNVQLKTVHQILYEGV